MNVNKISINNDINRKDKKIYHNTKSENYILNNSQSVQISSYSDKNASEAIKNSRLASINFTGQVENIILWKPSTSSKEYYAKLENRKAFYSGKNVDKGAYEAIRNSGLCSSDAKIVGHIENTEIDYQGEQLKTVYFSDPNERIYSGIKSSYDYVVYGDGAFDDEDDIEYSDSYDAVSDWESFGWIDPIGPSWL